MQAASCSQSGSVVRCRSGSCESSRNTGCWTANKTDRTDRERQECSGAVRMGRAEQARRMQSSEVSPPSENASSDEEDPEWPVPRAGKSTSWFGRKAICSSVISEDMLPMPGQHCRPETAHPEVHMWSAKCEEKLVRKHERFLDEAYLERGIGQDQALALIFAFDFDLTACRKNIQRLKNANTPLLSIEQQKRFQHLREKPNRNKRFNDTKDFFTFHLDPLLCKFSVKELVNYYYHAKLAKLKEEVQFWVDEQKRMMAEMRKQSLVKFLQCNENLKTRATQAKVKKGKKAQQKQRCDNCLRARRELQHVVNVSKVRLCGDCVYFFARHNRLMEVSIEVNEDAVRSPPKRMCLAPPPTLPSPSSSDKENENSDIIHVQSRIRKVEGGRITEVITLD